MVAGATNREITAVLCISEHTLKAHVRHILKKLGVENRSQATAYTVHQEIMSQPSSED